MINIIYIFIYELYSCSMTILGRAGDGKSAVVALTPPQNSKAPVGHGLRCISTGTRPLVLVAL